MNDTIEILKAHKSVRKFQNRDVEEDKVKLIIECGQCAPTSSFIQAYSIIRIIDKEKRKAIAALAGNQRYIEECPLFLVFCADVNRHKIACEMNNKNMVQGYTETFILATVDAALAAQNTLIAAESLGLGGVYIGGIRNNPQEISKLLNIPQNVYPVFGMCLGYPDQNPDKKTRLPYEIVLKLDEYNTEGDIERLRDYDSLIREYYLNRTGGERADTWTNQVSELMSRIPRPHMREYLDTQGFKMK